MKNLIALLFAGIIGGLVTLGGFMWLQPNTTAMVSNDQGLAKSVSQNYNVNPKTKLMPFDFTMAAEKATPAVVHISAAESEAQAKQRYRNDEDNDPFRFFFGDEPNSNPFGGGGAKRGSGSGVIISNDGYIVTNNHVVEFADEVDVTLSNNKTYKAEVVGTNKQTDLAVLKIKETNLPTLDFADSDNAKIGEWVLAVGNPFDLTSTVTAGIISAKGRSINIINRRGGIEAFIQTDAAVNPGNSGGALVDSQGRLLGINTAIATRTGSFSGYSFAIPVNMMRKIVDDIIQYGSYQRAFIGINIVDMDSELAEELDVNITQGVYIDQLVDGGAGEYAGLLPRDVITEIDGRRVNAVPELQEVVGRARVGDTITLTILRKGETKKIPLVLKAE